MSAIEKLKDGIRKNWDVLDEQGISEEKAEEIRKKDRNIVRKERTLKNFQILMLYIIILLIFIWLMFFVVLGVTSAPNSDMTPNIKGGDLLFYYRIDKLPANDDVIVFKKNGTRYIGRIAARGGDTVEILKKGGLIVNGNKIVESNAYGATLPREGLQDYPLTLAKDEYFILADARDEAEDSRYFGPVKKDEVEGVLIGVFRRTNM